MRALVGLQVGGIQEDVGKAGARKRAVTKGAHMLIEPRADARDLGLRDPGIDAERAHQIVDLAGADPVDVGLHHDRPQRPVDATARLEQRGEERPVAELWDLQLQIAGLGGQKALAGAVAMGDRSGLRS